MDGKAVRSAPSQEGARMARGALKLLAMVIFLGIVVMWIMMPTNTYRQKWRVIISAKIASTYFGAQGFSMLMWAFPMLFLAVLGCLYLHLGQRLDDSTVLERDGKKHSLAVWKKPMLVKGPLGIVTGIELALLVMFVALLIWSFSTYLHNAFAKITPESAAEDGLHVWQDKLEQVGLRLGLVGNICLAFLFFPVTRGSSVLPLVGLTSEASVKYHIWLGHMVMVLFTAHGVCYVIFWVATNQISQMIQWDKSGVSNVAGEISLLAGLVMWATTFPRIRRKFFELFFYTHYLYIIFMLFFVLHAGINYSFIMLPGFYLFMVDRYLRFLQSRQRVRLLSARVLPGDTVELNFSKTKSLSYNPTSIVFVNVPSISKLQWHPFTVSSNCKLEPETLSVVIKGEGSWSKKLCRMLSSPSSVDRLEVSIEGPYGPASTHFLSHDTLVMVSGGSGITPFISIIRELIYVSKTFQCKTPRVFLISAFKDSSDLTMLDLLLPVAGTPDAVSSLQLQIEAYVTREKESTADSSKLVQNLWFKPHATDAPITPILGPSSWLWLGAIISSSFIIFLILIGIVTRYYIYPIDKNKNLYPYSSKTALNILLICISIVATASEAFFWNKRKNAAEVNKVQNMGGSTPATSPDSMFYNTDRELESLPSQSLREAINIHYGERPDLKRILFECKGSSVGVLVCGPKKLKRDVATICSSGLADNLHFESISFSW